MKELETHINRIKEKGERAIRAFARNLSEDPVKAGQNFDNASDALLAAAALEMVSAVQKVIVQSERKGKPKSEIWAELETLAQDELKNAHTDPIRSPMTTPRFISWHAFLSAQDANTFSYQVRRYLEQ